MWQPIINPISAAAAAATSAALAERASSVVAIAGMVRDLVLVSVGTCHYLHVTCTVLFNVYFIAQHVTLVK